jgi:AraC-like DNA-binding protein
MWVYFSTDHVPPRDREPFWLGVVAKHVMKMTLVDRPDPATFRAQLDVRVAGRFTLFDYQTSHRIGKRTAADVSRDDSGKFQLRRVAGQQIYTAAATRASAADLRLGPRDFCVTSTAWPYESLMENGTSGSGLLIPHGVLSPLLAGGRLIRPVQVSGASPLGSFDAAVTQLPLLSLELGDAVLQNLCGLVALACGASDEGRWSGRESLRATQLEAAKRYVDDHLSEPNLTPGNAAAALGVSVRHLHLLFEPTGTSFAQYVARQRLVQCRASLSSPTGASRSVADIAFGCGFNSLATFYRAFEREFGSAPAALRATAAGHSD